MQTFRAGGSSPTKASGGIAQQRFRSLYCLGAGWPLQRHTSRKLQRSGGGWPDLRCTAPRCNPTDSDHGAGTASTAVTTTTTRAPRVAGEVVHAPKSTGTRSSPQSMPSTSPNTSPSPPRHTDSYHEMVPLRERVGNAALVCKAWAIGAVDMCGNVVENVASRMGWNLAPRVCERPLAGKVCIVTGGNAGIGLATAELLATRGAHVILACRSAERGEAAALLLRTQRKLLPSCKASPNSSDVPNVEFMQCDLASLQSVRDFCDKFNARRLPLHLLVGNAGIMSPATRLETGDGLEMQFQVNFLSHWYMANTLLGEQRKRRASIKLQAQRAGSRKGERAEVAPDGCGPCGSIYHPTSPPPSLGWLGGSAIRDEFAGWGLPDGTTRIVLLSSLTHHAGMANWKDKQSTRRYDPFTSYALSKLANVIAAVELQRRLDAHSLDSPWAGRDAVVAVHPGVVDTNLATSFFKQQGVLPFVPLSKRFVERLVDGVGPMMMKTPASSAATVGVAALAPNEQVAGKYIVNGQAAGPARAAYDPRLAQELWDVAQRLTGLEIPASLR